MLFQSQQSANPDQRIVLEETIAGPLLSEYAYPSQGMTTGDNSRYERAHWEINSISSGWEREQNTTESTQPFGGRDMVLLWEDGKGTMARSAGARVQGHNAWGKLGVAVSRMGRLPSTLYTGQRFPDNTVVITPRTLDDLPAIWAFCSSPEFNKAVRRLNQKASVATATTVQVPFDFEHWQKVAEERYPDGLPKPYSSDPTQWLFGGTVPASDHPLQVAMARLLGYRWPEQVEDGLNALADPDGIVCLPSVYQEPPAHVRLRELLQRAHGDAWSEAVLRGLLADVGAPSLEGWLRSKTGFFAQHVKLFHHRPFLWHLTDGRPDGFGAIVNYHRLNANTLSKLIYTYLGDWIGRQERAVAANEAGAQGRLDAATALRARLIAIAEGETPYDIYVRWKSLAEQPIGWNPDLNDGVRLNIRPFMEAGILASKVNVKWGKDRGADPAVRTEPLRDEASNDLRERINNHASTERHNNLHFSTGEKRRARELAGVTPGLSTQ
jgi:hypothetical protein